MSDWQKIKSFAEFIKKLNEVRIIAPLSIWDIPIDGYNVKTRTAENGEKVPADYHYYLCQVFKKFVREADGEPLFSENQQMVPSSPSVGVAASTSKPVLSLTIDKRYEADEIHGWLKGKDGGIEKSSVKNLYDESQGDSFKYLTDFSICAHLDPRKNPLWNIDVAKKILEGIDFINVSNNDRRALLIKHGTTIAEVNGWKYNREISELNSAQNHPRYIFDSGSRFTAYRPAYLSIDQEGPEVCFELCASNGSHLGEISWDGKWKEAKDNHGIKVS